MAERYEILVLNQISQVGLKRFPAEMYSVTKESARPDAILVRSADMHALAIPDSVRAIGRAGAGTNNIPVPIVSRRGVPVFNAPGANANAVKELVLASLLLAARNICQAWDFARGLTGDDEAIDKATEAGKKKFVGFEMPGRTLGVVGLGAIGVEVANSALALGMKVLRLQRWTCGQIAGAVGVSAATAARILRRAGLSRRGRLGAPPLVQRYEHPRPGDLLHLDTKKLGRIAGLGHRITGRVGNVNRHQGIGWDVLHIAVDDYSRVAYVESFTRIDGPSLSCRLIRPVADRVYVQWPELAERLAGSRYLGSIFSAR